MTTTAELVASCRTNYLESGRRTVLNALNGALGESDTTIALLRGSSGIAESARLGIDFEDLHVWDAGSDIAVERGVNGTTAAAHADGTLVYVNPNFSAGQILRATNDTLDLLSSPEHGLYQTKTITLTYSSTLLSYDMAGVTDEVLSVEEVRIEVIGSSEEWPRMRRFDFARNMPTADFPSGYALMLRDNPGGTNGARMQVTYRCPYGQIDPTSGDSVEVQTGMPSTGVRVLPVGAALQLVAGMEVRRADTTAQSSGRRAEEAPPGSSSRAYQNLERLFLSWVSTERARLMAQYPMRRL